MKLLSVFILLLLTAIPLWAGERIVLPDGIFYHRFGSNIEGAEAIWTNPAALGLHNKLTSQFVGEYYDSRLTKSWGMIFSGDGIGTSFRRLEDVDKQNYDEYIFAAGFPLTSDFYAGASYLFVKSGAAYFNKRHMWNIGILMKPRANISYSVMLTNLNRGRVDGARTDFEQIYSVSYRSPNRKFVFSTAMSLSSGQDISQAEYNYGLSFYARPDLGVYANMKNTDSFEIGLLWNLNNYFFGGQSRYSEDRHHRGSSIWAGVKSPHQSSFGR